MRLDSNKESDLSDSLCWHGLAVMYNKTVRFLYMNAMLFGQVPEVFHFAEIDHLRFLNTSVSQWNP